MNWQEMATQLLKSHARKYQENAPQVAAQYNLDTSADKLLISKIIAAQGLMNSCGSCSGINCTLTAHIGKRPRIEINDSTKNGGKFLLEECPKFKAARLAEKAYYSGLPSKYEQNTWSDVKVEADNQQAVEMAFAHLQTCQHSLYLYGTAGCGKTMLAVMIGKEYLAAGKTVEFWNVENLLADLQATFNDKSRAMQYAKIMERCARCDLLILDDMGAEKISEWTVKMMQTLINMRYNAQKPLLMTSNYTAEELMSEFARKDKMQAGRIASRLREMAYFVLAGKKDRRVSLQL